MGWPVITWGLIALNILVFVYQNTLPYRELQQFIFDFGMIPAEIQRGQDLYTLLTAMFVHGGLAHIASNMLFLWIFGDNIEQRFGRVVFLVFYLVSGILAGMAHILTNDNSVIPTVGASGAVSGVLGAYIVLYPLNRVRVLIWFYILRVPAFIFLGVWFLTQFASGLATLNMGDVRMTNVAFWAHVGGFVAGVLAALVIGPLRPEPARYEPEFRVWRDREIY